MKACSFLLAFGILPLHAQLADDAHWFYDYDGPSPEPFVMTRAGDYLYTGGLFLNTTGVSVGKNLVRFNLNTEAWEAIPGIGSPLNGSVRSIYANGGWIYIGGNFSTPAGTSANRVARFNPGSGVWEPLYDDSISLSSGDEYGPSNGEVRAITRAGDYIYVGGSFTNASWPLNERIIRRYRISTQEWLSVGEGLAISSAGYAQQVLAMTTLPDGSVLAGGAFTDGLARWNGSSWSAYGGGIGGLGVVRTMAVHPDGRIFIGGSFDQAGSGGGMISAAFVAAYDPSSGTWDNLAGGFDDLYEQSNGTTFTADGVYDIAIASDGKVFVAGDFQADPARTNTNLDHVAMWDDSGSWKALGSGLGNTGSQIVNCLEIGPLGDLYAGGTFSEGWRNASSANTQIARWDPNLDFADYVPGAAQNRTMEVVDQGGGTFQVSLETRSGTDYTLESAADLGFSPATPESTFTGNGSRMNRTVSGGGDRRFYRFRATDF